MSANDQGIPTCVRALRSWLDRIEALLTGDKNHNDEGADPCVGAWMGLRCRRLPLRGGFP